MDFWTIAQKMLLDEIEEYLTSDEDKKDEN